jgi:hypothetical protein
LNIPVKREHQLVTATGTAMNEFLLTLERVALAAIIVMFAIHYTVTQITILIDKRKEKNGNGKNH